MPTTNSRGHYNRGCTSVLHHCRGNAAVFSVLEYALQQNSHTKGQVGMDRIKIEDSRFLIKYACEDLRSLRSVLQSLQEQTDFPDSQDVLAVVIRALDPITADIWKAADTINEELKNDKSAVDWRFQKTATEKTAPQCLRWSFLFVVMQLSVWHTSVSSMRFAICSRMSPSGAHNVADQVVHPLCHDHKWIAVFIHGR